MVKTILITGGAGFVGSALALSLKANYPDYGIIAFDNLKRRGSELNVPRLTSGGVTFVHGDVRSKEDFDALPAGITTIIDASAEPSVLAGLDGTPDYLINTNLTGTINCLNFATKCKADFIFLSTSRVYPIAKLEEIAFVETETRFAISREQRMAGLSGRGISEQFPLDGYRSLYGTSKLASELIIGEYNHFYGIRTVINRCGVLTGPWQMGKVDQGVVVLWMARHFWQKNLAYIGYGGKGKQVRDMLHVQDLYRLVDYQMHRMDTVNGETFNVGGGTEVSVSLQELTRVCEKITGNRISIAEVPENRAADVRIYITDNSKVTRVTGWKPEISVESVMEDIYQWIAANQESLKLIL